MPDYHAGSGTARRPLILSKPFAQGAAGAIHRIDGQPGMVAKIYLAEADRQVYARKIATMLARPPSLPEIVEKGQRCVQIAWPTEVIEDAAGAFAGFIMPEVDFKRSRMLEDILQKGTRKLDGIAEFYGYRVLLAANLAALMADLHTRGHYMIDMKPENMRFYPDLWYMAILDTDGFSIKGNKTRVPSDQVSDNYIAPEAKGKAPKDLGKSQDLFALAVIIFRLLNNGIHPYQGVSRKGVVLPAELQARIFEGLYAYGKRAHPSVTPKPATLHETLEDDTRHLFDRAFEAGAVRPTADEWRDHLRDLVSKRLVKCKKNPAEHGHFSKGCGHCQEEQRLATVRTAQAQKLSQPAAIASATPQMSASVIAGLQGSGTPAAIQLSPAPPKPAGPQGRVWSWIIGLAVVGALLLALVGAQNGNRRGPATSPNGRAVAYFGNPEAHLVRPGEGAVYVNVRSGPGREFQSLEQLAPGTSLLATGRTYSSTGDPWLSVRRRDGSLGYVKEALLVTTGNAAAAAAPAADAAAAPAAVSAPRPILPTSPPSGGTVAPPAIDRSLQASFPCANARAWDEMTICSSRDLARIDREMGLLYDQRRSQLLGDARRLFRDEQRDWLHRRRSCQQSASPIRCLNSATRQRIETFRAQIAAEVDTETSAERSPTVSSTTRPASRPGPRQLTSPIWERRPSGSAIRRFYPQRAIDKGMTGHVRLRCQALQNRSLACDVVSEEPEGLGFGRAAQKAMAGARLTLFQSSGVRLTEGDWFLMPVTFEFSSE